MTPSTPPSTRTRDSADATASGEPTTPHRTTWPASTSGSTRIATSPGSVAIAAFTSAFSASSPTVDRDAGRTGR